jgi:hypothetical protein
MALGRTGDIWGAVICFCFFTGLVLFLSSERRNWEGVDSHEHRRLDDTWLKERGGTIRSFIFSVDWKPPVDGLARRPGF